MKMDLKWNYTNKMVNDLVRINRAREVVDLLPLPISIEEEIKKETMVKRVHYSTKIEGNKLICTSQKETNEEGGGFTQNLVDYTFEFEIIDDENLVLNKSTDDFITYTIGATYKLE